MAPQSESRVAWLMYMIIVDGSAPNTKSSLRWRPRGPRPVKSDTVNPQGFRQAISEECGRQGNTRLASQVGLIVSGRCSVAFR